MEGLINFVLTAFQVIDALLRLLGLAKSGANYANEALDARTRRVAAEPCTGGTEKLLNACCWLTLAAGCGGAFLNGCAGTSASAAAPVVEPAEQHERTVEALPELAVGESLTVDVRGATAALASIPSQEIEDQILDWALRGLAERWQRKRVETASDEVRLPPVRLDSLRDAHSFQYGAGRHLLVGEDALLLVATGASELEKLATAEAADGLRATTGRSHDTYLTFSATPERRGDAFTGRILVTRTPDVSKQRLFGRDFGYIECEARDRAQLEVCLTRVDDLTFLQNGVSSLKLGGRVFAVRPARRLSFDDLAALVDDSAEVYSLELAKGKHLHALRQSPCNGLRDLAQAVAEARRAPGLAAEASSWLAKNGTPCAIDAELARKDLHPSGKVRAEREPTGVAGPSRLTSESTHNAWLRMATGLLEALERIQCVTGLPEGRSATAPWRSIELSMVYADVVAKQWLAGALLDGLPLPWVELPTANRAMPSEADALSMWIDFDRQASTASLDGQGGSYFRRWVVSAFVEADDASTAGNRATSTRGHRFGWWNRHYPTIAKQDPEFALINQAATWTRLPRIALPATIGTELKNASNTTSVEFAKWLTGAAGAPAPRRGVRVGDRLLSIGGNACMTPIMSHAVAAGGRDVQVLGAIRLPSPGFARGGFRFRAPHASKPRFEYRAPPRPPRGSTVESPYGHLTPHQVEQLARAARDLDNAAASGLPSIERPADVFLDVDPLDPIARLQERPRPPPASEVSVEPAFKRDRLPEPTTSSRFDEATGHRVIATERGSAPLATLDVSPRGNGITIDVTSAADHAGPPGLGALSDAIQRNDVDLTARAIVAGAAGDPVKLRATFETARTEIEGAALTALQSGDAPRARTLLDLARNGLGGTPRENLVRSLLDVESGLLLERATRLDGINSPTLDNLRKAGLSEEQVAQMFAGESVSGFGGEIRAVPGEGKVQIELRLGREAEGKALNAAGLRVDAVRAELDASAAFYIDDSFGFGRHEIEAVGEEVIAVVVKAPDVRWEQIDVPLPEFEPDMLVIRDAHFRRAHTAASASATPASPHAATSAARRAILAHRCIDDSDAREACRSRERSEAREPKARPMAPAPQ